MARVAIYDACVLHPAALRDLLIRLARAGFVRARWTETIQDECFDSILRRRPELKEPLRRTRELMNLAVADCLVTDYQHVIEDLSLPDPDDRHVLAAAIHGGAEVIVTFNLVDFPNDVLDAYEIETQHPDDFVLELIETDATGVMRVLERQASDSRHPPRTVTDLLETLRLVGLSKSVDRLLTRERGRRRTTCAEAGEEAGRGRDGGGLVYQRRRSRVGAAAARGRVDRARPRTRRRAPPVRR